MILCGDKKESKLFILSREDIVIFFEIYLYLNKYLKDILFDSHKNMFQTKEDGYYQKQIDERDAGRYTKLCHLEQLSTFT